MNIIKPMPLTNGISVNQVETYANGAFTMYATASKGRNGIILFNSKGIPKVATAASCGVMLSSYAYLVMNEKNSPNSLGNVYYSSGEVIATGFKDFQVFENNWYVLMFDNTNVLYNSSHQEVTRNFAEAKVFPTGYALRMGQNNHWDFYSLKGRLEYTIFNIEVFLGKHYVLTKARKCDDFYQLRDHSNKVVIKDKIYSYINYSDGSFVVNTNEWCAYFDSRGKERCRSLREYQFLPDGTAIEQAKAQIAPQEVVFDAKYASKHASYQVVAGHYYFVQTSESLKFFSNFKNEIAVRGTYEWHDPHAVMIVERFTGKRVKYRMFNHHGEVFNTSDTSLMENVIATFNSIGTEK